MIDEDFDVSIRDFGHGSRDVLRTMYGLGLCLGLCLTINTGAHCFVSGGTETLIDRCLGISNSDE